MEINDSKKSFALFAHGFAALVAALVLAADASARITRAAPFCYVTLVEGNVSVIDTATKAVVATIPVAANPVGVAVAPDGKHLYVTQVVPSGSVSVIDTLANAVTATIAVGKD